MGMMARPIDRSGDVVVVRGGGLIRGREGEGGV